MGLPRPGHASNLEVWEADIIDENQPHPQQAPPKSGRTVFSISTQKRSSPTSEAPGEGGASFCRYEGQETALTGPLKGRSRPPDGNSRSDLVSCLGFAVVSIGFLPAAQRPNPASKQFDRRPMSALEGPGPVSWALYRRGTMELLHEEVLACEGFLL